MAGGRRQTAPESAWRAIRVQLREKVGDDVFESWFSRMDLEGIQDDRAKLSLPARFLVNWVRAHYAELVLSCIQTEMPGVEAIDWTIGPTARTFSPPKKAPAPINPRQAKRRDEVDAPQSHDIPVPTIQRKVLTGLPREHLLDELATVYIQAIVAAAGATVAGSRLDYGIDGTIRQIIRAKKQRSSGYKYVPTGFPIDFQLKGTSLSPAKRGFIAYDLQARNYDMIVNRPSHAAPLYLFLVCFDPKTDDWLTHESNRLVLNASAFWWRETSAQKNNSASVRIRISHGNRLTVGAIADFLYASEKRFVNYDQ